ncbi:hypothetical protein [Brevundimonas sp.]|uniref:hypothetical protein n=1 Tax=Brevundimonas sp. TaxID=1871086 RepID=UPI001A1EE94E|nr:hypothetical protein [Brevundimonas sp.]MBJ7484200.1 hypothetical protein [Brevundimonas sp.]
MSRTTPSFGHPPSPMGPWKSSPFNAEMAPTAAAKRAGAFSNPLYLGLLVKLPDPDGVGSVELEHPGYIRQIVDLTPRSASHLTIPRHVQFEVQGCPSVIGLALFNADAVAEAYGVLRSHCITWQRPQKFEFASHQILVKRPTRPV